MKLDMIRLYRKEIVLDRLSQSAYRKEIVLDRLSLLKTGYANGLIVGLKLLPVA